MAQYVCNVDTWGASPSYHQGELIPEDCPYDVEAAAKSGKVVTVEEYKQAHPTWDPQAEAKASEEQAAFEQAFPGREAPTAAALPDPEAEKALYAEAAKEAETQAAAQPVQVQQGSAPPRASRSSGSGTSSSS
jgi:hypothetical protein